MTFYIDHSDKGFFRLFSVNCPCSVSGKKMGGFKLSLYLGTPENYRINIYSLRWNCLLISSLLIVLLRRRVSLRDRKPQECNPDHGRRRWQARRGRGRQAFTPGSGVPDFSLGPCRVGPRSRERGDEGQAGRGCDFYATYFFVRADDIQGC